MNTRTNPRKSYVLPDSPVAVIRDLIIERSIESVFECGCGESTLLLAEMYSNGTIYHWVSVEDNIGWYGAIHRQLRADNLPVDNFHVSRLEPQRIIDERHRWYSMDTLKQPLSTPVNFDLLLIGGPSSQYMNMVRYPTLHNLYDRLNPGGFILLDDAQRRGEKKVLARWMEEYPIEFERQWVFGNKTLALFVKPQLRA